MSRALNTCLTVLAFTALAFAVLLCGCSKGSFRSSHYYDSSSEGSTGGVGAGGGTGTSGGTTAPACLMEPSWAGSLTGLMNPPAIKSSYATLSRIDVSGVKSTSLIITSQSDCVHKDDIVNPGKCLTVLPKCTPRPYLVVTIILKCSSTSSTTNICDNFDSMTDQDLSLATASANGAITISAVSSTNLCDTTGGSTTSYIMPYLHAPTGTIRIENSSALDDGNTFTVKLTGVTIEKGGNDATNKLTLDGIYSGEILTPGKCSL